MLNLMLGLIFMMNCSLVMAANLPSETKPPKPITTAGITTRVLEKTIKNSHYKVIGSCTWKTRSFPPKLVVTPALEQFLPDFVVTVSNRPHENPWLEANALIDSKLVNGLHQKTYEKIMGLPLDVGEMSNQIISMHLNDERTKVVFVIGSPPGLYNLSYVSHKPETHFGVPYYSSLADAIADRTEVAEMAYEATHPHLLINHEIGSMMHTWGPEVPRLMRVTQPYNFRASVVTAMHAVDIVTNHHELHVVHATENRCGKNCVVANATYDPSEKNIIWQEVYPKHRNIRPGSPDDFGVEDDIAGHGNYVFVVWRKYRGCVHHNGELIKHLTHPKVGQPQKR
jgi:integrating conjugative element protein (TIGR03756 family)